MIPDTRPMGGWARATLLAAALVAAPGGAIAQSRGATIVGVVRDEGGRPVAGAEVGVEGAGRRVRTDAAGAFRVASLAAGPATITARRIGFGAWTRELRLDAGDERVVQIVLVAVPEALEGVTVTAPRQAYDSRLAGFNERVKTHIGHFVTRERIERANNMRLTDILRELPGIRVHTRGGVGRTVRLRGADCPPLVFVDGFPATAGEFDLDMLDLGGVEGIEVYGGISSVPPEFSGVREQSVHCGVIAVWSRPSRPRQREAAPAEVQAPVEVASLADVLTRGEVEVPARLASGSPPPVYPDSLLRAHVAGRVVIEVVVDTLGAPDLSTLAVLASSHERFTAAVRGALAGARFTPAMAGGRRVRQYVQLPYTFTPGGTPD
jgi:TonB family protein